MKIGVLTSSRADFGIYLPLLNELRTQSDILLTIIAFGSHLSPFHGDTIHEIEREEFLQVHQVKSILLSDDEESIAKSYGLTVIEFSKYWNQHSYDLVLTLGDRYEMSAAVQAGIPFGVKFAHFHGGETTTGAIDNIYRDQISLAASLHFTAHTDYSIRLKHLLGSDTNVHTVGSISLTELSNWKPKLSKKEFLNQFSIMSSKYILITFHPETVIANNIHHHVKVVRDSLENLVNKYFLVITLPNNDTFGSIYISMFKQLKNDFSNRVVLIDSFGKKKYFTAMKYASLLLGNTSSGILEAASFGKYVINVGQRQKGRVRSENTIDCDFNSTEIVNSVQKIAPLGEFKGQNVYYRENCLSRTIHHIKKYHESVS